MRIEVVKKGGGGNALFDGIQIDQRQLLQRCIVGVAVADGAVQVITRLDIEAVAGPYLIEIQTVCAYGVIKIVQIPTEVFFKIFFDSCQPIYPPLKLRV